MSNTVNTKPKILVIGLDGATFDLLLPWIQEGYLPTLNKLMTKGVWGELESTIPMFTPTAWSSFMTGKNPCKHGVLGFYQTNFNDYSVSLLNPHKKRGKVLWDYLSENDTKSIIINVPTTYPPQPLNGFLISGMMTPPNANYAFPKELVNEINSKMPYKIYPSITYNEGEENKFYEEVIKITNIRFDLCKYLLKTKEWNFSMIVFTGGDILQHALWKKALKCEKNKENNMLLSYYSIIDQIINDLMKYIDNGIIIIMSDHGFGELNKFININTWLLKNNYIKIKNNILSYIKYLLYKIGFTPENVYNWISSMKILNIRNKLGKSKVHGLLSHFFLSFNDVDWEKTKAYSIGSMGQIYLNKVNRESKGSINNEEINVVIKEIIGKLKNFSDRDIPVFKKILLKEEIYKGKYYDEMPEIILYPTEGFIGFEEFEFMSNESLSTAKNIEGTHRLNGIFIGYNKTSSLSGQLKGLKIYDLFPTILYLFGINSPKDTDGVVIQELINGS